MTRTPKRTTPARAADDAPVAEGTREALLAAGRRLFSQHGYDATSVRDLTSAAGANLGAVTYHFGSKQALYYAVVEEALRPFADRVVEAASHGADSMERVASVVVAYFDVLREMPEVPFLLLQEVAAGRGPPPPAVAALKRVLGAVADVAAAGQADGSVRAGDPRLFALSVIAQPIHLSIVAKVLATVAGLDQTDAATRQRITAHVVAFVQAGLREES